MVWAELVERDVAEVGDEVGGDVGGVGAPGVLVDLDDFDPSGQVLGEGGYAGQWAFQAQPLPEGVHVGQVFAVALAVLDEVRDLDQLVLVLAGEAE